MSPHKKRRNRKKGGAYSDDFRRQAIQAARDSNNLTLTAQDLGVSRSTLSRWLRQADQDRQANDCALDGGGVDALPPTLLGGALAVAGAAPFGPAAAMAAAVLSSQPFASAHLDPALGFKTTGDVETIAAYATFPATGGPILRLDNPARTNGRADGKRQPAPVAPLWADPLRLQCASQVPNMVLVSVLEATAALTVKLRKDDTLQFRWAFHLADPRSSAGRHHFALLRADYALPGQQAEQEVVLLGDETSRNTATGQPGWQQGEWRLPLAQTANLSAATEIPVTFLWACCSGGQIQRTFYESNRTVWKFPSAQRWQSFPSALLLDSFEVS